DRLTLASNLEKVYAVGDVITGPANVATAMGYGKQAAAIIDKQLTGRDRMGELRRQFNYPVVVPAEPMGGARHEMQHLPAPDRHENFSEVTLGLNGADALAESSRCLRCDVKASPETPVPLTVSAQREQEVRR
ncbi:MAG: hypothetical protein WCI73_19685, partial [Phycisphaerae bacterium]